MVEKRTGNITGWANYSISKSIRRFADINNGEPFPFQYDRRHVVNMFLKFKINRNKAINVGWVASNGYWMNVNYDNYYINGQLVRNFKNRNNFQVPPYHP